MRILLVEDDTLLAEGVKTALIQHQYRVDWVANGPAAVHALAVEPFDAMILDLGLPGMDGMQVLAQVRRDQQSLPVLILTARDALESRLAGLNAGADDYLLKPFELAELLARLRAIMRRALGQAQDQIAIGDLVLDTQLQEVYWQGHPVSLSRREYALLLELIKHRNRVLSRQQLETLIYGWDDEVESNALEVHIHHLRKKLAPHLIRTLRGVGYLLHIDETS